MSIQKKQSKNNPFESKAFKDIKEQVVSEKQPEITVQHLMEADEPYNIIGEDYELESRKMFQAAANIGGFKLIEHN